VPYNCDRNYFLLAISTRMNHQAFVGMVRSPLRAVLLPTYAPTVISE
jgi:hypothetical protein